MGPTTPVPDRFDLATVTANPTRKARQSGRNGHILLRQSVSPDGE